MKWQYDPPSPSMQQYFREINRYELLTKEEEIELGNRIQDSGDEKAVDDLVTANLRFVVSIARQSHSKGLPIEDVIAEGNLGLRTAAQRYDPSRGYRFVSYAVWWIRQRINQYVHENHRNVRISAKQEMKNVKIRQAINDYEQRNQGRQASVEELAELTQCTYMTVKNFYRTRLDEFRLDNEGVRQDDDKKPVALIERLVCGENPEEHYDEQERQKNVAGMIRTLNEREQFIVRQHYGFDADAKTLEEIASNIKISRERVRQIRNRALEKLEKIGLAHEYKRF